jgi:LexA DNA binding domain
MLASVASSALLPGGSRSASRSGDVATPVPQLVERPSAHIDAAASETDPSIVAACPVASPPLAARLARLTPRQREVFDFIVGRIEESGLPPTLREMGAHFGWRLTNGARDHLCLDFLRSDGSAAAPGFMRPEGVVIFHTASGALFKQTIEKDEEPKGRGKVDPDATVRPE